MPKCEIALRHGCSPVNFLYIFRTPFLNNTSGRLLLLLIHILLFNINLFWCLKTSLLFSLPNSGASCSPVVKHDASFEIFHTISYHISLDITCQRHCFDVIISNAADAVISIILELMNICQVKLEGSFLS